MRFRTLLPHYCSLLTQGIVVGQDDYGRDIIGQIETMNVPCRIDKPQERAVAGDTGTDYIAEFNMFFDQLYEITLDTEILNIVDQKGNPVIPGSFSVVEIFPIWGRRSLHHYEIRVKRK